MPWEWDTFLKLDPTKPESRKPTTWGPHWDFLGSQVLQDWVVSLPFLWDVLSAPFCAHCPTHPLQSRQAGVCVAAGRCGLAGPLGELETAKLEPYYKGIVRTCLRDKALT